MDKFENDERKRVFRMANRSSFFGYVGLTCLLFSMANLVAGAYPATGVWLNFDPSVDNAQSLGILGCGFVLVGIRDYIAFVFNFKEWKENL